MKKRPHNTRSLKIKRKPSASNLDKKLHHIARLISENRKVVFITGAGLSVSSGIPTFRGTDNSVWSKNTVSTATTTSFHKDPLLWYKDFWIKSFPHKYTTYKPTRGHEAISWLSKHFDGVRVITQNIDSLHQQTTQEWNHEEKLVEIHGRMGLYRCMASSKGAPIVKDKHPGSTCRYANNDWLEADSFPPDQRAVLEGQSPKEKLKSIPRCPNCKGPMAPLALLFNETYDSHAFYQYDKASEWIEAADGIVFVGTSFAVAITKYAIAEAQTRPLECALFNINPFQELEIKTNLRPINILENSEDVLPRLVNILKIKLGLPLSDDEMDISSNASSTPSKRSKMSNSDSEMSVFDSPSPEEFKVMYPLLETFDHARFDLDPVLPEPLPKSRVHVVLSTKFNRQDHPTKAVELEIGKLWRADCRKNPKMFNGLKFRMAGYAFHNTPMQKRKTQKRKAPSTSLTLHLGLTDYKTFRGTNWSPQATQLLSDGVRDYGDAGAYMSQKLGVVSAVISQDQRVVCIRRSNAVAEGQGKIDGPGGHPEPKNVSITMQDFTAKDDSRLKSLSEMTLDELFKSALDEVVAETNIPETCLSEPLLIGITRQNNSAGAPSAAFLVNCSARSSTIAKWYEKGASEKFESSRILFFTLEELQAAILMQKESVTFTPSFEGCISMMIRHIYELPSLVS